MEVRIEYAVVDSQTGEVELNCGLFRERAFRMVERWNSTDAARKRGLHYTVYERTVTTTDWTPTNTGVVGPMRGGITE